MKRGRACRPRFSSAPVAVHIGLRRWRCITLPAGGTLPEHVTARTSLPEIAPRSGRACGAKNRLRSAVPASSWPAWGRGPKCSGVFSDAERFPAPAPRATGVPRRADEEVPGPCQAGINTNTRPTYSPLIYLVSSGHYACIASGVGVHHSPFLPSEPIMHAWTIRPRSPAPPLSLSL